MAAIRRSTTGKPALAFQAARVSATTSGPASMLPATETPGSVRCPHQSMQRAPVWAAVPPAASMT